MKNKHLQHGFTLVELLVGLGILSVLGLAVATILSQTFGRLGIESKAAVASVELRNITQLISTELRMGAAISPYLPGSNPTALICSGQLSVTSTTLRFLVVHDDATATNGRRVYYVGYRYDAASKRLYRGQVQAPSVTACTLPATDPLSTGTAHILAENIVQIDADGNGAIDPVFAYASGLLTLNVGMSVKHGADSPIVQKVSTKIFVRSL